ncbi:MAG: sulfotransferase family 2 domain-containing protein, partial [Planctomycetota bacterium]
GVFRNLIKKPNAVREVRRRIAMEAISIGRDKRTIPGFLHVQKTGGTYLAQFNSTGRPVLWPLRYFGHCLVGSPGGVYDDMQRKGRAWVPKDQIRRYFVFSVCRNPFDLLVSYAGHAGGWSPTYHHPEHYDFELANGDFGEFLKRLADREFPWPMKRMLHYQMFADDGEFAVDWVMHNETLDDDARALAEHLGIRYRPTERTNTGKRPKDYRSMYTDSLVELVEKTWSDDLKLFGYEFERGRVPGAGLHRHIDDDARRSIRYDWSVCSLAMGDVVAAGAS